MKSFFKDVWKKMHTLAEHHYEPAIGVFMDCLEFPEYNWRREALVSLGYHYKLDISHPFWQTARELLFDANEDVRLAASAVLRDSSDVSIKALLDAMKVEQNKIIRYSIFESICASFGLDHSDVKVELGKDYSHPATVESLKSFLKKRSVSSHLMG